jgi:hypothetical protein
VSHFTVTVCLAPESIVEHGAEFVGDPHKRITAAVEATLAPFDENMEVEPYRCYEDDDPNDCTAVWSIRNAAENHRNGTGVKPYEPHRIGWSSAWSKKTEDEQRAEFARAAEIELTFPQPMSWEFAARFSNEHYEYTERNEDGSWNTEYLHVDEDGRAYTWSTRNPQSMWDWWEIGGRWQRHFVSVPGVSRDLLVFGRAGTFGDNGRPRRADDSAIYCDGGPVELLDFARMRDEHAAEELKRYDRWAALVERFGVPEPWERLASLAEVKHITWDEARARYNSQPIIKAARSDPDPLTGFMGESPEAVFGTTREEFERIARAAAVPGYALVTLTGEWTAPGRMGWFGMSSDGPGERDAFKVQASKYLDELPRDAWVVQVDCHI